MHCVVCSLSRGGTTETDTRTSCEEHEMQGLAVRNMHHTRYFCKTHTDGLVCIASDSKIDNAGGHLTWASTVCKSFSKVQCYGCYIMDSMWTKYSCFSVHRSVYNVPDKCRFKIPVPNMDWILFGMLWFNITFSDISTIYSEETVVQFEIPSLDLVSGIWTGLNSLIAPFFSNKLSLYNQYILTG